jgi:hypothetical protein
MNLDGYEYHLANSVSEVVAAVLKESVGLVHIKHLSFGILFANSTSNLSNR